MKKTYLTKKRKKELEEELEYLKNDERQNITKRLKEAKELGDLSENAEYHEAKDAKEELDKKINRIENILRNAEIIKKNNKHDKVRIGSKVKIQQNGDTKTYTIVGSSEADPVEGKISNESPLGKKLLGGKKGEEIEFETPKGKKVLKIKKIN